jgi:hypothetical protein
MKANEVPMGHVFRLSIGPFFNRTFVRISGTVALLGIEISACEILEPIPIDHEAMVAPLCPVENYEGMQAPYTITQLRHLREISPGWVVRVHSLIPKDMVTTLSSDRRMCYCCPVVGHQGVDQELEVHDVGLASEVACTSIERDERRVRRFRCWECDRFSVFKVDDELYHCTLCDTKFKIE